MVSQQCRFFSGVAAFLYCASALAADVYFAEQTDGTMRFSTEASAPGFTLFSRGEVPAPLPGKQRGIGWRT